MLLYNPWEMLFLEGVNLALHIFGRIFGGDCDIGLKDDLPLVAAVGDEMYRYAGLLLAVLHDGTVDVDTVHPLASIFRQ